MNTTPEPDDASPSQERVRSLLAGLPDPGPMPDDLVARIHARLAEESFHEQTTAPVVELASRRRVRPLWAAAGAAAAAAVVGGTALAAWHPSGESGWAFSHVTTSTAAPATGSASASTTPTARADANYPVAIAVSRTDVTEQTLDATASRLLTATATLPPGAAESPHLGPLATPIGLRSCLASHSLTDVAAASAQLGTYGGHAAVVVAVKARSGELSAWVFDRACTELVPHHAID